MSITWRSHGSTDVGRRRTNNEDSHLCDDELHLYVVADGMGGHAAGEVASAESVSTVRTLIRQRREVIDAYIDAPSRHSAGGVRRLIHSAIGGATYVVFGLSTDDESHEGMGTTVSTLLIAGSVAFVGQVGDSRVYLLRDNGVTQVTEDHTYVAWQVKMGKMTAEEAKRSRQRNIITRSVGRRDNVEVDTFVVQTQPGDRFLLCSDGLHDYVRDHDELCAMASHPQMSNAATALIRHANGCGGKDNITVVLVERD